MPSERHRVAVVAGGAVGVLGAALPWVAGVGFELDVYSVYALVSSTAVVTVAVGTWSRRTQLVAAVLAAVTTAFALEAIADLASDSPHRTSTPPPVRPASARTSALWGDALALGGGALARST
jgi:hypothetical protein